MNPSVIPPVLDTLPLLKSARRLRWFKGTFNRQSTVLSGQTGITFEVDGKALRGAFFSWLTAFEAQLPTRERDRPDYVNFAAGLMLRELVKAKPARVTSLPSDADMANPAYYWPEGYLYVSLCLNIRAAILEQDFDFESESSPDPDDLRTWWSFKENVGEDANLAIGFLDHFAGVEPIWSAPSIFSARKANRFGEMYLQRRSEAKLSHQ